MIVLDTNALRGSAYGPASSATLLRGLAREVGHPLAVPREVFDEFVTSFERDVAALISAGESERLLSVVPHWLGRADVARSVQGAALPSLSSAVQERRDSLTTRATTRVHVLDTPSGAAEEGLAREKSRRPPATASGHEARDVVVWLTAVQAAKDSRPSNVYFVSGDRGFCGEDRRHLHPELQAEAPPNLKFLPSVDALIDRLSCDAEPAPDVETSPEVLSAIEQTALYGSPEDPNHDLRRDLWEWTPQGKRSSDLLVVTAALTSLRDIASRRCGTVTLTAVDAVYRLDLLYRDDDVETVPVTVRLGILVTSDDSALASVRVLSRSGVRLHESTESTEESHGTQ